MLRFSCKDAFFFKIHISGGPRAGCQFLLVVWVATCGVMKVGAREPAEEVSSLHSNLVSWSPTLYSPTRMTIYS